jgi:hypothetical protein
MGRSVLQIGHFEAHGPSAADCRQNAFYPKRCRELPCIEHYRPCLLSLNGDEFLDAEYSILPYGVALLRRSSG